MWTRKWLAFVAVLSLTIASACGGGGGGGGESAPAKKQAAGGGGGDAGGGSGTFGTASITGKVVLGGDAPAAQTMKMDADPFCSLKHPDGVSSTDYVVGPGGGLRWAFVYVKDGLAGGYGTPDTPVTLDQEGCTYHPHVFGIMAGQELKILNSDETLHNIHSLPEESKQFNMAMPKAGMELAQKFRNPEVMVRIKCDVHPWMECWAGVLDHPFYAVSGNDGSFTIDKLPAGTYTIEAWHEGGGTKTETVTVADGESKQVTFTFQAA